MEILDLFPARVARCRDVLPPAEREHLAAEALATHLRLHPYRVPYGRPDRTCLRDLDPETWQEFFDLVQHHTAAAYGCRVTAMAGREVVHWPGTALPVHCEDADLSAIAWLDYAARPEPQNWNYDGMLVLVNPSGPFGARALPWEGCRNFMFAPAAGDLLVFPSYLTHWGFPYRAARPGIAVHFEMKVDHG